VVHGEPLGTPRRAVSRRWTAARPTREAPITARRGQRGISQEQRAEHDEKPRRDDRGRRTMVLETQSARNRRGGRGRRDGRADQRGRDTPDGRRSAAAARLLQRAVRAGGVPIGRLGVWRAAMIRPAAGWTAAVGRRMTRRRRTRRASTGRTGEQRKRGHQYRHGASSTDADHVAIISARRRRSIAARPHRRRSSTSPLRVDV
jgi:hypothetical protein